MKLKVIILVTVTIAVLLGLAIFRFVPGCELSGKTGKPALSPPVSRPLWQDIQSVENVGAPGLSQEGGDIVLEGFGELIGFFPLPDEDRMLLAMDWQDDVMGFYTVDLHSRTVESIGGVLLKGPMPKAELYSWPWVLVQTAESDGNYSWVLVDISSGQTEVVWESYAWVPQGLRRRPVWFSGETWYLGPVSGPYVTDILAGETIHGNGGYSPVNPVAQDWPRWAGGVSGSSWYMFPTDQGGAVAFDLDSGRRHFLQQDQELVWNAQRSQLAWCKDNQLGLLEPGKSPVFLDAGVVPGFPLWSANSNKLYFLGGDEDYFGITWKNIWAWDSEEGYAEVIKLPGNWTRWRLLAATEEAVLAAAGDGDYLLYIDTGNGRISELSGVVQWRWQDGTLLAIYQREMIRISPGLEPRILSREAEEISILALVNQFVIYSQDGRPFIKQLVK